MDYQKTSQILKVLGHPVRLRITEGLIKHECNVGKIVKALGLPQSTISQHLALLRNTGIVAI
ncbi:MAG: metalloregulator ArsR/SmtB family transcription factor, partial [Candidatus Omnitrophica bacterium]|nr:metalloregulator ArsR/SmtB family transcription factor [Candidatus Omnitrophota bacterium]